MSDEKPKYTALSARFLQGSFKGQLASVVKAKDKAKTEEFLKALNDGDVKTNLSELSNVSLRKLGEMGYTPAQEEVDKRTAAAKEAKAEKAPKAA